MNECAHLINDYLYINPNICHNGFYTISFHDFNKALHRLVPFERPDMYAVLDDMIFILEHFEFDASHSKKDSMKGKEAEALLEQRIEQSPRDGEFRIDKAEYEITFQDWQKNFNRCFDRHYEKIRYYKDNVKTQTGIHNKRIVTGFLIEDPYAPYVRKDNKEVGVLPYVLTKQFAKVFDHSQDVDFVLYAYLDGNPKLIYLDHPSLHRTLGLIDLNDSRVSISKINANECVLYGGFEI